MKSKKLVHGVGINDADYVTQIFEQLPKLNGKRQQKLIWSCPYYNKWKGMLSRCYSEKRLVSFPTYRSCTVDTEWLHFSCFREWYIGQEDKGVVTDGGVHLDKDLFGNGVYSPEICVFIHPKVNTFIKDNQSDRGELPLGVNCSSRNSDKFEAFCRTPFQRKSEYLGVFTCPNEAHQAWQAQKHKYACQLADSEYVTDERVAQALRERYAEGTIHT